MLGAIVAVFAFFVQVGAFSASGLPGMFDPTIIGILWGSPIGVATLLQAVGFSLCALLLALLARKPTIKSTKLFSLLLVGLFFLTYSYTLAGHSIGHGIVARFSLFLHVLAVSLWVGSLLPLLVYCNYSATHNLKNLMQIFSTYANVLVAILLLSGGFLLYAIMSADEMSWRSQYGYNLICKFILVTFLLALAGLNKWYWVPRIESDSRYVRGLKKSISLELILAIGVLLTTAFLITVSAAM